MRRVTLVTLSGLLALPVLLAGCGSRENPPSSRAGNTGGKPDSLAAAADSAPRAAAASAHGPVSDPRAVALAQRLLAALGGETAWSAARCWYFTYTVGDVRGEKLRRKHYWDRTTGQHRMEGLDRRQRPYLLIHTVGHSAGALAVRGGAPVTDTAEVRSLARTADSLWVNDSTWLLLPFKLRDPGARLAYGGTKNEAAKTWDVIEVAFDPLPLAPRGRYQLYLERTTGMLERTALVDAAGISTATYEWLGWRIFGGVLLAGERRAVGTGTAILFPQLAVLDAFPAGTFTAPEAVVIPAL